MFRESNHRFWAGVNKVLSEGARNEGPASSRIEEKKPPARLTACKPSELRSADSLGRLSPHELLFVQQHAFRLFGIDWAVEELVVFEEDLDEGRARGDGALDQRLRQRVFDVLLQGAA